MGLKGFMGFVGFIVFIGLIGFCIVLGFRVSSLGCRVSGLGFWGTLGKLTE